MGEPSRRMHVARLAREAALSVDAVNGLDAGVGGRRATRGGGDTVHGVVATATGHGTIAVDLFLVAHPVALHSLADRVRERVAARAATAGLRESLGPVNVRFEDLAEGGRA